MGGKPLGFPPMPFSSLLCNVAPEMRGSSSGVRTPLPSVPPALLAGMRRTGTGNSSGCEDKQGTTARQRTEDSSPHVLLSTHEAQ